MKLKGHRTFLIGLAMIAIGAVAQQFKPPENPDALWQIVSTQCTANQEQHGDPAPCNLVNKTYAVLKDKKDKTEFLLIPTTRSPGIEDPALQADDAPNYFAAAWAARHLTEDELKRKLPRQEIGLAINSRAARTQNQLHIHIDCLARDVRNAVQKYGKTIPPGWSEFPVKLKGHTYRARRVDGENLDGINPFALLAEEARGDMADETLAIAGATFQGGAPGFVLLADKADSATHNRAGSTELLDHKCAIAHESAP